MTLARNNRAPINERALLSFKIAGEKRRGANHVFYGKTRSSNVCDALSASKAGKFWWTDGIQNCFAVEAPIGWVRGMAKRVLKKN
jgi:hypothetical protein